MMLASKPGRSFLPVLPSLALQSLRHIERLAYGLEVSS